MAEIVIAVLAKTAEYMVAPIGRQLGYLFCFKANISTLEAELKKLNDAKDGVQVQVDLALRNVETINPVVEIWLSDTHKISEEAQIIANNMAEFPKGCLNRWCLNLKSRYTLSRNAKKKAEDIIKLLQNGKFENISFPSPSIPTVPSAFFTMDIATRQEILDKIIKKLKDEKTNMIGICGMGGIGKTTMAEQVVKRVMEDKLFEEWAKTTVGQNPDYRRIQKDIGEMLGLKLHEENSEVRQGRLRQRLNNKKVLIWLDDVWEEFDLRNLGITFLDPQIGIKFLFTSREQGFWRSLKTKIEFLLPLLSYEEAWVMFEAKVIDSLETNSDLKPVAMEIVKKCGGLPLALVVLGGALVGREKSEWKDALRQLKSGNRTDIQGVSSNIHQSLQLSYNFLRGIDAKSLFLLCCLYEKGSSIPVGELVRMALGLRFLEGISGLEDTECRVFALIEQLKRRSLLLSSEYIHRPGKRDIKMHDVVRDVAKSIAYVEGRALVIDNNAEFRVWQEHGVLRDCKWISIIPKEIKDEPSKFSSGVELLRCSSTVLQTFGFLHEDMRELRVLDVLESPKMPSSPLVSDEYCIETTKVSSSLRFPSSLRTLIFRDKNLSNAIGIGDLVTLEILSITDGRMEELPIEMEKLTNLISLDLSSCRSLKKIRHGVISKLRKLEELYMLGLQVQWGIGDNARLSEFHSLSNLHTLNISVYNPSMVLTFPVFINLKKYNIEIGSWINSSCVWERRCSISLRSLVPLKGNIKFLSENAEELLLEGEFTKSLVDNLTQYGSQSLKRLDLDSIETLEYLTSAATPLLFTNVESLHLIFLHNLQHMSCNQLMVGSFGKLKELKVIYCNKLKNIFELSIVRELVHLESVDISMCDGMEKVIWKEEADASNTLAFPKLERLLLSDMRRLKSFCRGTVEIQFPRLNTLILGNIPQAEYLSSGLSSQSIFPEKVLFPNLQNLELIIMVNIKDIWGCQIQSGSFRNLELLSVVGCQKLRCMFTPAIARYLVHLCSLDIINCSLLEVVIAKEEEEVEDKTLFPELNKVILTKLPALESFCYVERELEFRVLKEVRVIECPNLKTFSLAHVLTPDLDYVTISDWNAKKKETAWANDINSTITHLHKPQTGKFEKISSLVSRIPDEASSSGMTF